MSYPPIVFAAQAALITLLVAEHVGAHTVVGGAAVGVAAVGVGIGVLVVTARRGDWSAGHM